MRCDIKNVLSVHQALLYFYGPWIKTFEDFFSKGIVCGILCFIIVIHWSSLTAASVKSSCLLCSISTWSSCRDVVQIHLKQNTKEILKVLFIYLFCIYNSILFLYYILFSPFIMSCIWYSCNTNNCIFMTKTIPFSDS